MKIALFATSLKPHERRVPIYPQHLPKIPQALRSKLVFQKGYGEQFGYPDEYFCQAGAQVMLREQLFEQCELLVLPKPLAPDISCMREGQVLFGWAHCVQQHQITQAAIDQRISIIAWENMYSWTAKGERGMHIFYKNNELAGYSAVLHCLQLCGIDGLYGPRRKVVMLSYGSVSRGAIYALQGRGFNNIHVFSRRPAHLISDQNPDVYFGHYFTDEHGLVNVVTSDGEHVPLIDELSTADIICNCVMQDTDHPIMFVTDAELRRLKNRSIIIDISCDLGMGFSFARPTSFSNPVFKVGDNIVYYSVDHTPSYLWDAASREVSRALIPYLGDVVAGPETWKASPTIDAATEICRGVVTNSKILSFQNREAVYPHSIRQRAEQGVRP